MANVDVGGGNAARMQEQVAEFWTFRTPADISIMVASCDSTLALLLLVFLLYMISSSFPHLQADHDGARPTDVSNFAVRIDRLPRSLPEGNEDYESALLAAILKHVENASGVPSPEVVELIVIRDGLEEAFNLLSRLENLTWQLQIEEERHRTPRVLRLRDSIAGTTAEIGALPDSATKDVVRAFAIFRDSAHARHAPGSLLDAPFVGAVVVPAPDPGDVIW